MAYKGLRLRSAADVPLTFDKPDIVPDRKGSLPMFGIMETISCPLALKSATARAWE